MKTAKTEGQFLHVADVAAREAWVFMSPADAAKQRGEFAAALEAAPAVKARLDAIAAPVLEKKV